MICVTNEWLKKMIATYPFPALQVELITRVSNMIIAKARILY